MSNFCITRIIECQSLKREMFLDKCRLDGEKKALAWSRNPVRAHKFASWSEAEAIANLVPTARVCTAPVVQQPPQPTRLELLKNIARIAGDLRFEAVQHDPSTFRISRRTC